MKVDFNYLREKNQDKIKRINNPSKSVPVKLLIFDELMPYDIDILKFKTTDLYKENRRKGIHGLDCGQIIKLLNDEAILYGCGFDDFNKVIDYCIKENIRIINTSFGCSYSKEREEAIKRFYDFGGIWVAASGNDGNKPVDFPACSQYTVGVSATNSGDNNGPEVDTTTDSYWTVKHLKRDSISTFNGTSAATPVIASVAGYYLYNNPEGNLETFINWLNKNEVDSLDKVLRYKKSYGKLEKGEAFFVFPDDLKDGEIMSNVIRDLNKLHPYVKQLAEKLLEKCNEAGIKIVITETLRTMQRQAELYAQGRTKPGSIVTNAKPGNSIHNYGLAIDIVPVINGKAAWNRHDLFDKVGAIGESIGLTWGGHFRTITDKPHFQWTGGLALSQLKAGKRPETPQEKEPKQQVSTWAKEAWQKAIRKGINDGEGPKNNVTEEQLMVFFDRLGLLD